MKKIFQIIVLIQSVYALQSQTPADHVMMKSREICFGLNYEQGSWDQYWEGTTLRKNETVATLTRKMVVPMVAIGIIDKVNLIIGMPYVQTSSSNPNGGKFDGMKGFQDLNLSIKYEILKKDVGNGRVVLLSTIGYATPITNYLSDYRPYSIGNGTNEWSFRGIAYYKMKFGLYGRVAGAYLYRGQTKAERDYYYNNGSYYTAWMDVPSAWESNVVLGMSMLENSLKVEASYYGLKSTSGDDIRKYNAPQPTNKVEFDQVGIFAQYYLKPVKGMSVLTYFNQILNGRNMGKFSSFGAGLTYQFKI